jgi:hypothetical protein
MAANIGMLAATLPLDLGLAIRDHSSHISCLFSNGYRDFVIVADRLHFLSNSI